MHEPQHTVAEIVESLRDDCLWEDKEAEYAILKNAEAMVKDQMFKAGGAEQLIKSWLVQKVGNSLLGTLECIVLVLTSGSFYQVSYDPIANKLLKWSVWQNPIHLDQNFFDLSPVCLSRLFVLFAVQAAHIFQLRRVYSFGSYAGWCSLYDFPCADK